MKQLKLAILFLLVSMGLQAQVSYSISGTVKNLSGEKLPGATVFLDGTQRKTYTDAKGEFKLDNITAGTYQLTVHFIGLNTINQNVILQDKSIIQNITLKEAEVVLNEVVITSSATKSKYLDVFLKSFLGDTENGNSCIISNPEIIKFTEQSLYITAKTNDFLEIINPNLGYNIKYLLRDFRLNRSTMVTSYTGECVFEDLKGTDMEEQKWAEERTKAFHGSFMHFMRSVYGKTTDMEGFTCRFLVDQNMVTQRLSDKVDMNLLSKLDKKKLIKIRFMLPLYVQYDSSRKDNLPEGGNHNKVEQSFKEGKGSLLFPFLEHALVDSKGSLVDYRSFLIKMNWGAKRLGDQLPYEYKP